MSRIYRPRERTVIHEEPPTADLLREVRDIERRRVLLDMRDAIDSVRTRESDPSSCSSRDRNGDDVKRDILAALRRLEVQP